MRTCENCGHTADEVISAAAKQRAGWYCVLCRHFEKAIGRERAIK